MDRVVERVTTRIIERSRKSRGAYLSKIDAAASQGPHRTGLSCSNLAHAIAGCGQGEKDRLAGEAKANIGIVSAYNDMLSAHQPFEEYPKIIKQAARDLGCSAQFAGGVPAMCDGVTQGQDGMDLSLFSRDVIAMSTAVALSHNAFDAALCLGVCDKIVPGLLIGALAFGHLPVVFVPAGPMTSGLPNDEKAKVRQQFAKGEVDRDTLLRAESASYHSPGTCTFYGTANSNQMLMEFMGLHLPGSSFVNPGTQLRTALTQEAVRCVAGITHLDNKYTPVGRVIDEKAIVNGIAGLLATGGSTNHTLHLVAIAQAAGVVIDWQDFDDLSGVIPLLARVYPNGLADVNHFHAAGGLPFVIKELLSAGLLHEDVNTVQGTGLSNYAKEPFLESGTISWHASVDVPRDRGILRGVNESFSTDGGLKLVQGNLGRAVVKVSAVKPEHHKIEAPAKVFTSQSQFIDAFNNGDLEQDLVAVVTHQGPQANGMPELHKLTPYLGVLQDKGFRVALVTDGRMSGASGKVLAAIQVTPEALSGGALSKLRDGDIIRIDSTTGVLNVDSAALDDRQSIQIDLAQQHQGMGRELFSVFRQQVSSAEQGGSVFKRR